MPGCVHDERRQDDDAEPLGDHIAEQESERRHEHEQHHELADLDAEVEGEQRGEQVTPANCSVSRSAKEKPKPCTMPNAKATIQRRASSPPILPCAA